MNRETNLLTYSIRLNKREELSVQKNKTGQELLIQLEYKRNRERVDKH